MDCLYVPQVRKAFLMSLVRSLFRTVKVLDSVGKRQVSEICKVSIGA